MILDYEPEFDARQGFKRLAEWHFNIRDMRIC